MLDENEISAALWIVEKTVCELDDFFAYRKLNCKNIVSYKLSGDDYQRFVNIHSMLNKIEDATI